LAKELLDYNPLYFFMVFISGEQELLPQVLLPFFGQFYKASQWLVLVAK